MKVTYTPAGDQAQEFDFKPNLLPASMAEMIETRYGGRYEEWTEAVLAGSMKARRVLLWNLLSRVHGHVRFEDVDFKVGELKVERDLDELIELRAEIETWSGTGREELRIRALEEADAQIQKLQAAGEVVAPKEDSLNGEGSTPSPLPGTSI